MPFGQVIPRQFTEGGIHAYAPRASGVYGISNAREWIYVGSADDIQGALLGHLQELNSALMKRAPLGFVFEVCDQARRPARHNRLVQEYGPICNRQGSR